MLCACSPIATQAPGTAHSAHPANDAPLAPPSSHAAQATAADATTALPQDLWERTRRSLSWQTLDNPRIDQARRGLLRQANYFPVISERANLYLFYIVEQVEQRGMPVELALIPLVESTLDPFATSYAGAAGLWQIMPRTGEHLGIEQNTWYDGRQALQDSTDGALDYLQAMHTRFDQDWLLALAAYNAGGATVARAQKRNKEQGLSTDYWSLRLPREAYNYVPKIIALSQLIAQPARYQVNIPVVPNAPSFEIAAAQHPLHFMQAAELAGVHIDTLRALNAGHLQDALSPHRPTELLLPIGTRARFETNVSKLTPDALLQGQTYKVKRGDSLSRIAQRFGTSVTLLQRVNAIKGTTIRTGEQLKIPVYGVFKNRQSGAIAQAQTTATGYRVRLGDSLYRIANRFKISIKSIIAWNALDPDDYLQPGQTLTLYISGS